MLERIWKPVLLVALGALACSPTLSLEQESQLGAREARRVRQTQAMLRDRVITDYVRELGAKLATCIRPSPFELRFYVVEDESVDAFALPGGGIYVSSGLILQAGDSSELASVLAHEIAHIVARHIASQYLRADNATQPYWNTFSEKAEREANKLAIEAVARAGYDPYGMIRILENLQIQSPSAPAAQFLTTHPLLSSDMPSIRKKIEAAARLGAKVRAERDDGEQLKRVQQRIRLISGTDGD